MCLLQACQVRVLVDVRSSPYSKYAGQFNSDIMQSHPALLACGVRYLYAGKMLGGRPENVVFYDDDGHVCYDAIAASATFQDGQRKLLEVAQQAVTAIMCSEEDPHDCHRRLLIARVLADDGVTVRHIRGDGRVQTEVDLLLEDTAGQLGFEFDETAKGNTWKSIRSVSLKRAPPSFSEYFEKPESDDW